MLAYQEVATDADIFRPDGFIVFSRSDGDPEFVPPNLAVPKPTDHEVNYYHIFDRDEDRHQSWRLAIGGALAESFGLPKVSADKKEWKLYDFPANYDFAEQRKGPKHNVRTDPYLFARKGHRFRSTKEAIPHLEWLLRDPDLEPSNCLCKYCHGGARKSTGTPSSSTPSRVKKAEAAAAARASPSPRAMVPGVSIDSVPQRDAEIMRDIKQGQSEGFRVGEVVWYRLEHPIVDPTEPSRKIDQWPVLVEDPTLMVQVAPANPASSSASASASAPPVPDGAEAASPNNDGDSATAANTIPAPSSLSFSLAGRVSQQRMYHVRFLGAADSAKALETSLLPFLSGFIPEGLLGSALGDIDQHSWLQTAEETPLLDLTRKDGGEPNYGRAIVAFAYAMQTAAILRSTYVATDVYSKASTGAGMFQGLFFGVERIWVGEVVRLKLSVADLKKLQRELNAALVRALPPDAKDPPAVYLDADASYVLRLAAICKEAHGHQSPIRVAGEMYQIVTAAKYNRAKKEEAEREQLLLQQQAAAAETKGAGEAPEEAEAGASEASANATDKPGKAAEGAQRSGSAKPSTTPPAPPLRMKLPEPSILRAKPGHPAMPPLPQGFVMIPLSDKIGAKVPQEVSMPVELVAGRIYPSYGVPADGPRVDEQVKLGPKDAKKAADEDTQDELRARLSVAGLLGGCVKPMAARSEVISRSTALKAAFEIARGDIIRLITQPDELSEDELEDELAGGDDTAADISVLPASTTATTSNAAGTATATATATVGAGTGAGGEEAPGQDSTASSGGATKRSAEGEVGEATAKKARGSDEAEGEAPLPEGWITRASRSTGQVYYVYMPTKATQWERPT
ncbi:uncharacterized protein PFL1_05621 [Pseudozyma flocculosa PF-1]|uniref:WW domain-containing protein n=1 Tax=Pseudozyma flocculosa PF-1 TaxID=1277687 RepID=A0A061H4U6_9BASI|nr:uncharacterized protein PFL1_05621 [Pseudozyma flocculosa PF-1]EPQ26985.1 hypothetical protein PFL1_05621 [Pseudozyma flocculosa PF-1]